MFELWCKATWLQAQLGILLRRPVVQGKWSGCPILGGLLLPGSPAQADRQIHWPWLSRSPWSSLVVPKITYGKSLWCVEGDVVPGCGQGMGDALILCATSWLWYLYKQLSGRDCQVRSNTPQFIASIFQVHNYKFKHEVFKSSCSCGPGIVNNWIANNM